MAFFKKIKYAMGFTEEEDDALISDDPETVESDSAPARSAFDYEAHDKSATTLETQPDEAMQQRIFTHVVEVFNASLPEFLARSVDPEQQRKYLYETLAGDIRNYIDAIAANTREQCEHKWHEDRKDLQEKVNELEGRAREIESKRNELSQKQLSADRQRRALTERVHDLEKQVLSLEAEREQYQLESKSLVNKLKVANVHESENEELRAEITRLQGELNRLRAGAVQDTATDSVADSEMAMELSRTKEELEHVKSELSMSRRRLDETKQQLADKIQLLAASEKELKEANERIDTAMIEPEQLKELEEQLSRFEAVKDKQDRRIADLKKREKELLDEIERIKSEQSVAAPEGSKPEKPTSKRHGRNTADAGRIDDILSDTDWLVSPSALRGSKTRHESQSSRKKDSGTNPDQMSLF